MSSTINRVLVTGGTGFIGRHVTASLRARGFEVHLVARDPHCDVAASSGAVLHQGDLLDSRSRTTVIRDVAPTHLLHLAWYTAHGKFWNASENLAWVDASLDLGKQFIACGGRRVVCAGTCAEYDWSCEICSEATSPTRPATLYGKCKNTLRELMEQHASLHGVSTAWGRLFFVYGPHESEGRLLPSLMLRLLRNDSAECRYGDHVRDFLHTADAADAFAALLDSEVQGPVNIASGEPLRLSTLAHMIATIAGRADLLHTTALPGSPDNPVVLTADTRRLNNAVRWRPRIGLRRGLEELWEHYRQAKAVEVDQHVHTC